MDWLTNLLDKANPQDLVALAGFGIMSYMVLTKRQIARHTIELAIKYVFWIVLATIAARALRVVLLSI